MIIMKYCVLFLLIFLSNNINLFSLDPSKKITQYIHNVWQIEDGLPQNSIQCILQTKDGYIWFGTEEGLVRYDGLNFKTYDKYNTSDIKHNSIWCLYEDRSGTLWIGTRGGGLSKYKDSKFTHYTTQEGLSNDQVYSIFEDKNGLLWIGTLGGGLNQLSFPKEMDSKPVIKHYTTQEGLSNDQVRSIYEDRNGNLWIGTLGGGLNRYKDGEFTHYTTQDGLSNDQVRCIYEDKSSNLWIGTLGGGLNQLSLPIESGTKPTFKHYTTKDGLSHDQIFSIFEDKNRILWIGTRGGGLNQLSLPITSGTKPIFKNYTTKDGLSNDMVFSIYEANNGIMWIGTYGGGLNQLKEGKFTHYTSKDGLSNDQVSSIFEEENGTLWIGTIGGGLNRYKDGKFTYYTTKEGLSHNQISSIYKGKNGVLWIGTLGGGLNRFKNGKFTHYTSKEGLSNDQIFSIFEDKSGVLWIGTLGGGLNKFHNGKFTHYTSKQGLSNDHVFNIYEDKSGVLWIGTRGGGINQFKDNIFTHYSTDEGLSNNIVMGIYEDRSGVLWIGTRGGGLNQFKDGNFTHYTAKEGLFDDSIFWIQEDNSNNLWMTCNKGIFRVNKDEFTKNDNDKSYKLICKSYGIADGMLTQECNGGQTPAGWMSIEESLKSEGEIECVRNYSGQIGKVHRLYFPTIKGVAYIDPDNIKINELKPPVYIEFVRVNNQEVKIEKEEQDANGRIIFDNERCNIYLKYTACAFDYPKAVKFKYILRGYNNGWKEAPYDLRFKEYTNLPSGEYEFIVIACNNDGIWNEEGASFKFVILPSFTETLWFYGLCCIGLFIFGFTIYRFRVSHLKQREKKLQKRVDEQTLEIRQKAVQIEQINVQIIAEKEKSEKLLLNILPEKIAEELKVKGMVEPVEYKQVSVLFTDFKGFTLIAEKLSPKELVGELDRCFDYFDNLMTKYNLEKLKTIGDSYMCAGGIPTPNNSNAIDCILCAIEIQTFMRQKKKEKQESGSPYWELRLGIHSGPIIAGVVGNKKFAFDIWGDTVNTASCMESSGLEDKINVSYSTYNLAKEFFLFTYRGKISAKHKGEIDMYLVNGIKPELSINGEGKIPNELFKEHYEGVKQ